MTKTVSGIYVILNTKNGKIYIGQAQDFATRWYMHRAALKNNRHNNRHLQAAWNKYGAKAFKFQRLEHCPTEQLDEREQHYLNVYMAKGICYNVAKDVKAAMRGRRHSEETREKISKSSKSPTPETRKKMSEAKRTISEESRRRMSAPNKGKIVSEETRRKMSEAHKGHTVSEESRRRMSEGHTGKCVTPETRQRMSEVQKGHIVSEETRRKMSESQLRRYEHKRKIETAPMISQGG